MSTIDSQYLRVFATLSRHLNMSRAAQELKLTPSGISHCLKALEADLGCRLFERTSRKIALTEAGQEFLREAAGILESMAAARTKLRTWIDWRRGRLRIAASPTACQYLLPAAVREFRESFPEFTLEIHPCTAQAALREVSAGKIDLALLIQPTPRSELTFISIAQDELEYLLSPIHPWALKGKVNRREIAAQNLILPERESETYGLIEQHFRQMRLRLRPFIEIGHEEAIKQFVRLGIGIALLPRWVAEEDLRQGLIAAVQLGRNRLRRRWGILHLRSHKLTFAESLLVDLCRNVAREIMEKADAKKA